MLRVKDNGIGKELELSKRIFELFTQAERSPDRSSGGLSLGLALVKNLVELHGGTVKCFSEGDDRGNKFTVRLPLASDDILPLNPQTIDSEPHSAEKPLCILVVDDNVDAAKMLAMFLEVYGYQIAVEYDAQPWPAHVLIRLRSACWILACQIWMAKSLPGN